MPSVPQGPFIPSNGFGGVTPTTDPTVDQTTHAGGGGSGVVLSVTAADSTIVVAGTVANPTVRANVGTGAGSVAAGNDSRFTSDVQTVTAGNGTITIGGTTANPTVAATVGTTAGTVAAGNDSRIVNAVQSVTAADSSITIGGTATNPTVKATTTRQAIFAQVGDIGSGPITGVAPLSFPITGTIVGAFARVGTAPTGASIILDILKNGTTIYTGGTNRPTIPAGANVSQNPVTPAVTSMVAITDVFTLNITQSGSTVHGSDLSVFFLVIY